MAKSFPSRRGCELSQRGAARRLERTESAAMADGDQATRVVTELKDLGVAISIDDFGTGYSSLSYLQLLPVDMIKIDRSFVADLASSRVLVEAIAALARAWNMPVEIGSASCRERVCQYV